MMTDPLAVMSFLAGSEGRCKVLRACAEHGRTRAELAEQTDLPRATLGRILTDLEDRELVRSTQGAYEATPAGRALADVFQRLCDAVEAIERLDDLLQWFPFEDVTFGPERLRDATILRPSGGDANRPLTRSLELIQSAQHVRLIAGRHATPALEKFWQRTVVDEHLQLEMLLTEDLVTNAPWKVRELEWLSDLINADEATLKMIPGSRAYNCAANDQIVVFALSDNHGAPQALIESEDQLVQDWFGGYFERVATKATPLEPSDFPRPDDDR